MKRLAVFLVVFSAIIAGAQVRPPKHESRFHHLFASHRDVNNLEQRYNDIRCALVVIQSGNSQGTGFFVSSDGDIATAFHVLGERVYFGLPNGTVGVSLLSPFEFSAITSTGEKVVIPVGTLEKNADAWGADVALLKSGKKTNCWLRTGDDRSVKPGEHLIAMGFPGLAFGSLSLYTGIMSARLKSELIVGTTVQGQPLKATNDFVRVQMPISTGLSGAPVIDDENRVIAIVTNAGAWSNDLELVVQAARKRQEEEAQKLKEAQKLAEKQHVPLPPQQHTLDWLSGLGQLAGLLHDYVSPGYGDAVPMRYLRKAPQAGQQP